jgi:hypothetical protein
MKSFHQMASMVNNRVFRRSVSRQTAGMDPDKRAALVDQVAVDFSPGGAGGGDGTEAALLESLREINGELQEAETLLATSQEKEQFLGVRARRYRKALDAQAEELRQERNRLGKRRGTGPVNGPDAGTGSGAGAGTADVNVETVEDLDVDVETAEELDLERRMEKWEKDEDALQKIVATHKSILVYCETIRRTIRGLKEKREKVAAQADECQEFLMAAAEAEDAHMAGTQAAEEEEEESRAAVEMRSLAPSAMPDSEEHDVESEMEAGIGGISLGETNGTWVNHVPNDDVHDHAADARTTALASSSHPEEDETLIREDE